MWYTFLEHVNAYVGSTAIGVFLTPSEIATDWDERRQVNDLVQQAIAGQLGSVFKSDWTVKFQNQVGPVLEGQP